MHEAPGEGFWERDTTHFVRPMTPAMQSILPTVIDGAIAALAATYGFPLAGMDVRMVGGYPFMQPRLLFDGNSFAERTAIAEDALATRRWRSQLDDWRGTRRSQLLHQNRELQAIGLPDLDDDALSGHIDRLVAHASTSLALHFELHGPDQIPVGLYLAEGTRLGLEQRDLLAALGGYSPASTRAGSELSLDDRAWWVTTSYDIDGPTACELDRFAKMAEAAEACSVGPPVSADADAIAAQLRALVPEADQPQFDASLAEARLVYGLRDDHVGLDFLWPMGLVRHALLEVGRRLQRDGRVADPNLGVLVAPEEVRGVLAGELEVDLAARAREREEQFAAPPPKSFGEEMAPPLELLPTAMATLMGAYLLAAALWYAPPEAVREPLRGTGVGRRAYRGRALVVRSAEDALARLDDGDVLVAPITSPAFNPILPLAGAMVVEEGGPLCHAAIAARELGLPAIIGARDATARIATGDLIEVDPVAGLVVVLERARA